MKQIIYLLFISLFLFNSPISAQEMQQGEENGAQEKKSVDEQINEAVGPWTDYVSKIIFYEIPLKKGVNSPVSGQVRSIDQNGSFRTVIIEGENGVRTEVKVPGREPIGVEEGDTITADTVILPGLGIPMVLIWLVLGAIIFTLYFRFVNFSKFKLSIDIVRGKYTDPKDPGEVSHFQALTTALSATVGLGNIAGVAIAISIGGPGAMLWMIIAGLIGMSSKFVECTLGVHYRKIDDDGTVHGGPMYYLSRGLKEKGMAGFGKVLAVLFAIFCIGGSLGGGNMFQANQAFKQFSESIGSTMAPPGFVFGLVMAILVALVIIGGIKSIARVTEKIVPFMVAVYVIAAIVIIGYNYDQVPAAFGLIFDRAFGTQAVAGGLIGVLIQGFRRAAFSNEAGIGSASIAHAAVKTNNPASEGLVALLEPFIDTVVVCTMTALVIIITDNYHVSEGVDGVTLTSQAFASVIVWFPYVLSMAVILFAFSTMISWSYYGVQSWTYLFGTSKRSESIYKIAFCIFIIIGSSMSLDKVVDFSDAMIFAMAFPNILGLYFLMPVVRQDLNNYLRKIKSGEIIRHD